MDFKIPEEFEMLQLSVRRFVKGELIPLERIILGREGDPNTGMVELPQEEEERLRQMVREMELWGMSIPEELGGSGLPTLAICLIEEELAKTITPFNFGDVSPILFDCNESQRENYLQPLIEGQKRACLAIVEEAVTDLASMKTTALKNNGTYTINGKKVCLTNVTSAGDFAIVFAVTDTSKGIREGTTCFLIDRDTPGFTLTGEGERVGMHAQVAKPISLTFADCSVPSENIVGEEGQAFRLGLKWLPLRRIMRGAKCVGAAESLLEISKEYAMNWVTFGQLIKERPNVQRALADMYIGIKAARLIVHHAAWKADEEEDISQEAAIVKVFATDMLEKAAQLAEEIHGGPMHVRDLPIQRLFRNATAASSTEQALEIQRAIIARDILKY